MPAQESQNPSGSRAASLWHVPEGPLFLRLAAGSLSPVTTLWLWVLVVAVGDFTLTLHGLDTGLMEINPIGRLGLTAFGGSSLAAGKLLALGLGFLFWRHLSRLRLFVPVIFLILWGGAMLWNAALVIS